MKIQFIGTGSAFCLKNYHANAIISEQGKNMLMDAGSDVRFSLSENGLTYKDIDAVYITHFHTDHIGGLEYLAFNSYFDKVKSKIKLFIHESFIDTLWNNSLKAGLGMIFNGTLTLDDFFEVIPLKDTFIWESLSFKLIPTFHVSGIRDVLPVYGLFIDGHQSIYFTGDTRYVPQHLESVYQKAQVIIHDAETSSEKSVIHAHYEDITHLKPEIKCKTYLWHYHDNVSDNFEFWQKKATDNGFRGFLRKGDVLHF
ncbi:MAG: ribonuclease Z [Bacteroidetes bacterium ADurb.Bin408]|nr:MAG: ribonuclease Z [Bacteroidetes bacterium ADurb.Bin408]